MKFFHQTAADPADQYDRQCQINKGDQQEYQDKLIAEKRIVEVVEYGKTVADDHMGYVLRTSEELDTHGKKNNTGNIGDNRGDQYCGSEFGVGEF